MASHTDEDMALFEQQAKIMQMQADTMRKMQEVKLAPWHLVVSALLAGAALMGSAMVVLKYVSGAG